MADKAHAPELGSRVHPEAKNPVVLAKNASSSLVKKTPVLNPETVAKEEIGPKEKPQEKNKAPTPEQGTTDDPKAKNPVALAKDLFSSESSFKSCVEELTGSSSQSSCSVFDSERGAIETEIESTAFTSRPPKSGSDSVDGLFHSLNSLELDPPRCAKNTHDFYDENPSMQVKQDYGEKVRSLRQTRPVSVKSVVQKTPEVSYGSDDMDSVTKTEENDSFTPEIEQNKSARSKLAFAADVDANVNFSLTGQEEDGQPVITVTTNLIYNRRIWPGRRKNQKHRLVSRRQAQHFSKTMDKKVQEKKRNTLRKISSAKSKAPELGTRDDPDSKNKMVLAKKMDDKAPFSEVRPENTDFAAKNASSSLVKKAPVLTPENAKEEIRATYVDSDELLARLENLVKNGVGANRPRPVAAFLPPGKLSEEVFEVFKRNGIEYCYSSDVEDVKSFLDNPAGPEGGFAGYLDAEGQDESKPPPPSKKKEGDDKNNKAKDEKKMKLHPIPQSPSDSPRAKAERNKKRENEGKREEEKERMIEAQRKPNRPLFFNNIGVEDRGFQLFIDRLVGRVQFMGGKIRLSDLFTLYKLFGEDFRHQYCEETGTEDYMWITTGSLGLITATRVGPRPVDVEYKTTEFGHPRHPHDTRDIREWDANGGDIDGFTTDGRRTTGRKDVDGGEKPQESRRKEGGPTGQAETVDLGSKENNYESKLPYKTLEKDRKAKKNDEEVKEKVYQCTSKPPLDRHEKERHIKEKNFRCAYCDICFNSRKSVLDQHIFEVHPGCGNEEIRKKNFYKCNQCPFQTVLIVNMEAHRHTHDKNTASCSICHKRFTHDLSFHMAKYHPRGI